MTRDEYQELAALWGASAPADDERELIELAQRTPRLARLSRWGELGVAALLAITIVLAMIWRLGTDTLLMGSLVLVLLGWSSWKRHHFGNAALLIDRSDRISFIESTVRAKEAELNRSALGLALLLPGTVIAMLLSFSLRAEGGEELADLLVAAVTTPRGLIVLGFVLCALLLWSLSHIRLMGELIRLRRLHADYEEERRRDHLLEP